jgi:hypothetical protein
MPDYYNTLPILGDIVVNSIEQLKLYNVSERFQ